MNKTNLSNWISVNDRLPEPGVKVLAAFKNDVGYFTTICASHIPRWHQLSDCEADNYDEYNDERDCHFLCEGWYEEIVNWGDFSSVYVSEGVITHWMQLPVKQN